ncbi:MAG: hypothetical protein AMXMBFR66_22710 [Pseudomonadota bacterium]|nr:SufD family Fe-S cluster assembly protein [Rubrivivax sp.]
MDSARADVLAARRQLETQGWIARNAENFRHQPPPPVDAWLGDDAAAAACDAPAPAGFGWTLLPFGEAPQGPVDARWLDAADPTQRAELLAGLPAPGAPVDGAADDAAPFAWAHRALCRQGLRLTIGRTPASERGGPRVVSLALRHRPRSAVEAPLLVLDLAAGVHCVLVETHEHETAAGSQPIVQNLQIHVRLAEGATLQHLRSVAPQPGDRIAHHLHLRAARGARFEQATIAAGSQYQLHRHLLELQGPGAVGRSAALLFADTGAIEQQLRVAHQAGGTTSAVEMLALASGSARAVLNARARIAPGAAEANVHQRLSGIPTGGQPKLVLRPHLEILHDQVQATHGATWGALPEEEIFYARQRGLDERTARHLIVEGMTQALLQRCFSGDAVLRALGADALLHEAVARHLKAAEERDRG